MKWHHGILLLTVWIEIRLISDITSTVHCPSRNMVLPRSPAFNPCLIPRWILLWFVHVLVYAYCMVAVLGPKYRKSSSGRGFNKGKDKSPLCPFRGTSKTIMVIIWRLCRRLLHVVHIVEYAYIAYSKKDRYKMFQFANVLMNP